jgi:hypothetical protein
MRYSLIGTAAFTDCCGVHTTGKKKAALREERGR